MDNRGEVREFLACRPARISPWQPRVPAAMPEEQGCLSNTQLNEVIIHLTFSAAWPKAMSAISAAKGVCDD